MEIVMEYYVQFDKQGPVEAKNPQEAQEKAARQLIVDVRRLLDASDPVEDLAKLGFSIRVSIR